MSVAQHYTPLDTGIQHVNVPDVIKKRLNGIKLPVDQGNQVTWANIHDDIEELGGDSVLLQSLFSNVIGNITPDSSDYQEYLKAFGLTLEELNGLRYQRGFEKASDNEKELARSLSKDVGEFIVNSELKPNLLMAYPNISSLKQDYPRKQ